MRLKEEQKQIVIGIIFVLLMLLQIVIDSLVSSSADYYQLMQKENFSILTKYGNVNNLGLNYINANSETQKLFSWRQGDKPLGEAQVKTIALYHDLTGEDQKKWGERTLFEYYFNKSHQIANQINEEYLELSHQIKKLNEETNDYTKLINRNEWWRKALLLISTCLLIICVFLYRDILAGLKPRQRE